MALSDLKTRCVFALILCFTLAHSTSAAEWDELILDGYQQAYNLDYDAAITTFERAVEMRPNNSAGYRGAASALWLRLLFSRGNVLVDNYLIGSFRGPQTDDENVPEDIDLRFQQHIDRAIKLAEAALTEAPNDPDAHYELGLSVGLLASYRASIRGESLRAVLTAKRAYDAHQRVLELDPSRDDAKFLVGIYRYIVSVLPRLFRLVARLVGFDGGKNEAMAMVTAAASHPGKSQAEAQFALVLLLNREREYVRARQILELLLKDYPKNRLVWLELASTWLRDKRPAMAELTLTHGFRRLQGDDRVRMFGEGPMWYLKRGTARASLGLYESAQGDLMRAAKGPGAIWVSGRAHLELGKIADLAGDRELAQLYYSRGRHLCDDVNDRRCERESDRLRNTPYRGQ